MHRLHSKTKMLRIQEAIAVQIIHIHLKIKTIFKLALPITKHKIKELSETLYT